jgi:hypothetical protein
MMAGACRARRRRRERRRWLVVLGMLALPGCEPSSPSASALLAQEAISLAEFAGLVERLSEPGGYFDTDNLISNESGYLNVLGALERRGTNGGAYVGVGPDQSFSYLAQIRPEIAFIVDVRRDNLLHHLLLKALIQRSPTRIEFLAGLHGVAPPDDPAAWQDADIDRIVAWVDSAWSDPSPAVDASGDDPAPALVAPGDDPAFDGAERLATLQKELVDAIGGYRLDLSDEDFATIRRFHDAFVRAGLGLRFTSFGRPPRPYYPTYRQLVLETDVEGDAASYLATRERYEVVRRLQLANRVIPVVGDLAGRHALRELGVVLREMELELTAFYASNVEYYLWQDRTFERWLENLRRLPTADDAVVIRSYFANFGRAHPSAVPGYYATQILQPVATLDEGGFASYWEVVTRDVVLLR